MIVDIKGVAAKTYETLWMEERLKRLEGHRDQIIEDLHNLGADPWEYTALLDRPNWVYAIRLGWVITVIPGMITLGAYLLKGNKKV